MTEEELAVQRGALPASPVGGALGGALEESPAEN